VTISTAHRPAPATVQQWWVLSSRLICSSIRNGEVALCIVTSVVATAGFYIPLNELIEGPGLPTGSYAQYLLPLITLVAIAFASIATAFRAATDSVQGINRRLKALPIAPLTPLLARITASFYRCAIALAVALACGYAIGFRFHRGPLEILAFCLLVLLTGIALSFIGDVIGTSSRNPAATSQWLLLPVMIFGYLSVGIQPLQRFPEWIQPIVSNQPISRIVYALQALAGSASPGASPVTWSVIGTALAWIFSLIALTVPLALLVYRRRV